MADESSHGNTPPSLKNFDNDSNMDREGSDDDSDTPPDLTWLSTFFDGTHSHEGPPQDGVSQPASQNYTATVPRSEDCDSNASAHRDLTWETEEAPLAREHNKMQMQYPVADASSHVQSKCGKTLEDSHLTERHQPLHRDEESQHEESDVSAEAMEERNQQKSEDKEYLLILEDLRTSESRMPKEYIQGDE
ncbi:hypothetical protein HPB50_013139 [Hyalomma asiaticum]|uniref:Uncharacterized protein n=1 Tax=Hyalomma asiaticum TaxID=266040 RepID=A0ACB7RIE6_HYAAI|nr:hypothetical protein HPB50_013139 [Hyalomma asiaticum]